MSDFFLDLLSIILVFIWVGGIAEVANNSVSKFWTKYRRK